MADSDLTGYPIIMTKESQLLLGYILKKDLKMALGFTSFKYFIFLLG